MVEMLSGAGSAAAIDRDLMAEAKAVFVGLLIASVIPAAVLSSGWPLDGAYRAGSILGSFLVFYPFSALATALLGLPTFLLLRPFRPGRWWLVLAVGFLLGALVVVSLQFPSLPGGANTITNGILGALAALAFWLTWRPFAPTRNK